MAARHNGSSLEDMYEILKDDIGDGSFGSVALARVRSSGAHVARRGTTVAIKTMKKTFESFAPCLELREVVFLRTLPNHAHLVPALDIFLDPYSKKLHICMEYMDGNLYQLMKARDHKCLDGASVKSILFQILSGLEHIHAHNFFHRDVKPENILVSTSAPTDQLSSHARRQSSLATPPPTPIIYTVKIADFGLARETQSKLPYTTYVSTRWYRAPEVLLRAGHYSAPVDIWALGAMAVEVATLKPLFPGSNEVDQVWRVCEVMGSPGNWYSRVGGKVGGGDWAEGTKLAQQLGFSFPKMAPHSIETILNPAHWPTSLSHLVTWCLMWDPKNRPTSTQALNHEYFHDAFDPLRPKSASSRKLSTKPSDLSHRTKDGPEPHRTLTSKPSWFRRSLIGREALARASSPSSDKTGSSRPTVEHTSSSPSVKPAGRPQPEKRFTWTNGLSLSGGAPMPILPTIRPISPLSDAVTAKAGARQGKGSSPLQPAGEDYRTGLDQKTARKIGRQLSVASHGNQYADIHRQETERALNGNGGLMSPPSSQKEGFFSHLRKRARRLSGRNQFSHAPNSDDLEANVGCGPWSSNRSSMAVDLPSSSLAALQASDEDAERPSLHVRYSADQSSQSTLGYGPGATKARAAAAGSDNGPRNTQSLHLDAADRVAETDPAHNTAPVSSRTRRALQRASHSVPRYETPDEQEELMDEMNHGAHAAAARRQGASSQKPEADSGRIGVAAKASRRTMRQAGQAADHSNPYPTPTPSAKRERDYLSDSASQSSPIPISGNKASCSLEQPLTKWPTPPYDENEWAASAAASIYAAGAAYR